MGNVGLFWGLVYLVVVVLSVVLFFKLWIMTNDIRDIKNYLIKEDDENVDK